MEVWATSNINAENYHVCVYVCKKLNFGRLRLPKITISSLCVTSLTHKIPANLPAAAYLYKKFTIQNPYLTPDRQVPLKNWN